MTTYQSTNSMLSMSILFLVAQVFSACSQVPAKTTDTSKIKDMNILHQDTAPVIKSDAEWKQQLSAEQYYILREKGTERPFTGKFLLHKEAGMYTCAACGNPLFASDSKFDSHCGWPSFDKEVAAGRIKTHEDHSLGMDRTEITCGRCGGHLGHVFNDGPTETGLRYCVNSVSLGFVSEAELAAQTAKKTMPVIDTITLGGGCFWCVEAVYERLDGVIKVESGYAGGKMKNASYEDVSSGGTGHAEVVQITFDNTKTSLDEIFKVFFTVHDPTTLNRQGADVGTQYRSVIFYRNAMQQQAAQSVIEALDKAQVYDNPVVTEVAPFDAFYKAEDYHQDYYNNNKQQGYCRMVIQPKVEKFEKLFKDRLKKETALH